MKKLYSIVLNGEIIRVMTDVNAAVSYTNAIKGSCFTIYLDRDIETLEDLTLKEIRQILEDTEKLTGDILTIKSWVERFF